MPKTSAASLGVDLDSVTYSNDATEYEVHFTTSGFENGSETHIRFYAGFPSQIIYEGPSPFKIGIEEVGEISNSLICAHVVDVDDIYIEGSGNDCINFVVSPQGELSKIIESSGNSFSLSSSEFYSLFNLTQNNEQTFFELPEKVELLIDGTIVATDYPKQNYVSYYGYEHNGWSTFILKDESDCNSLPYVEYIEMDSDTLNGYGYTDSRVTIIATYSDSTQLEATGSKQVLFDDPNLDPNRNANREEVELACPDIQIIDSNTPFLDTASNVFEPYILNLYTDGVISGFSDKTFRPEDPVTRSQMAKFVVKAFELPVDTSGEPFPDVQNMNDELSSYVQTLKNLDIVSGYTDGNYRPDDSVTRGQVTKFVTKALEAKGYTYNKNLSASFTDVPETNPFYPYIAFLSNIEVNGEYIIKGYSTGEYKPDESLSRGAMSKVIDLSRQLP
ncbi:S-layer homology domain-containing protein [Candidatus Dojkabacteria bacterium]|uniref:S-layer homology domain-containing protein n=1 Tax=Candidatus Dojkabacteria bacterium TaxID=2099670 RepID=A0A955L8Q8_9BACT|nr:S-layer homology domain-containing protein [Candidatus Dojkabacteria bacterium]